MPSGNESERTLNLPSPADAENEPKKKDVLSRLI
jgi:hypothetical protein